MRNGRNKDQDAIKDGDDAPAAEARLRRAKDDGGIAFRDGARKAKPKGRHRIIYFFIV